MTIVFVSIYVKYIERVRFLQPHRALIYMRRHKYEQQKTKVVFLMVWIPVYRSYGAGYRN